MDEQDRPAWTPEQVAVWPLLGLELRTERLVLRPVEQGTAFALADLAARGIHDPATMPFQVPFTDAEPDALRRSSFQFHARLVAEWTPERWRLLFVTSLAATGEVIGAQSIDGDAFVRRRVVTTGSWLGLAHQGHGYGKEQRAAVLTFGFAGLGAERAETGAWHDNTASLGVTRALGYEPNGDERLLRRDEPDTMLRFTLPRARWEAVRAGWPGGDIAIVGLDAACLELFGLAADGTPLADP